MAALRHVSRNSLTHYNTISFFQSTKRLLHSTNTIYNNNDTTQQAKSKSKPKQYDWLHDASIVQPYNAQSNLPSRVRIVEVGPRDGLQNESILIDSQIKIELINKLIDCGLTYIEATSFVSPKWVPQMSDNSTVINSLPSLSHITYPVLIPNIQGLNNALQCRNIHEIAIFASASETFSQANINCSIDESLQRFIPIIELAKQHNIKVRGYVSCVLGCPYEGKISYDAVEYVSRKLLDLGCYEISLGDTIGIGNAGSTDQLLSYLIHTSNISYQQLAVHFHDTYGQALNNIYVALQHQINVIDSSVSGLGGCPYAKGATGNVATEDVLYMLNGLGIHTGIDMKKLVDTSWWISKQLDRVPTSKVSKTFKDRSNNNHINNICSLPSNNNNQSQSATQQTPVKLSLTSPIQQPTGNGSKRSFA